MKKLIFIILIVMFAVAGCNWFVHSEKTNFLGDKYIFYDDYLTSPTEAQEIGRFEGERAVEFSELLKSDLKLATDQHLPAGGWGMEIISAGKESRIFRVCPDPDQEIFYLVFDGKVYQSQKAFLFIKQENCSNEKNYSRLNKESFSKLDSSSIKTIDLVADNGSADPNDWTPRHREIFPITDYGKISEVVQLVESVQPFEYYGWDNLLFKTKGRIYVLRIGWDWDNQICYGDWWQSEELFLWFKEKGLKPPI